MIDINKYKLFVRNFSLTDDELASLINTVIVDIAKSTKIFKDMIGFSIIKDYLDYDFEMIMKMNDRIKVDVGSVSIGELSDSDIINYLSNYDTSNFPSPNLTYETIDAETNRTMIDVDDVLVLNAYGYYSSIFNKFSYLNRFKYRMVTQYDLDFDDEDKVQALAIITTTPDMNNITDDIVRIIEPALIEGLKYFVQTPYTNPDDMQSTSIILNRYNYEKQRLMDMFPTTDAKFYKGAWL
jgi:hypothetical protein